MPKQLSDEITAVSKFFQLTRSSGAYLFTTLQLMPTSFHVFIQPGTLPEFKISSLRF
jgi:hypothetical protein